MCGTRRGIGACGNDVFREAAIPMEGRPPGLPLWVPGGIVMEGTLRMPGTADREVCPPTGVAALNCPHTSLNYFPANNFRAATFTKSACVRKRSCKLNSDGVSTV